MPAPTRVGKPTRWPGDADFGSPPDGPAVARHSVFDIFHIGIGPSSSHTVGPMRAAGAFVRELEASDLLPRVARVSIVLYGSLGATGKGHGTDRGVILGLAGKLPETVTSPEISGILDMLRTTNSLALSGCRRITFDPRSDIVFRVRPLDRHPNGLTFHAFDVEAVELMQRTYYSIGGGGVAPRRR